MADYAEYCDHVAGRCADLAHQGIGGLADREWFAAQRARVRSNPAPPASAEPGDTDRATAAVLTTYGTGDVARAEIAGALAAAREQGRAEGRQEVADRMEWLADRIYEYREIDGAIAADRIRAALEAKP